MAGGGSRPRACGGDVGEGVPRLGPSQLEQRRRAAAGRPHTYARHCHDMNQGRWTASEWGGPPVISDSGLMPRARPGPGTGTARTPHPSESLRAQPYGPYGSGVPEQSGGAPLTPADPRLRRPGPPESGPEAARSAGGSGAGRPRGGGGPRSEAGPPPREGRGADAWGGGASLSGAGRGRSAPGCPGAAFRVRFEPSESVSSLPSPFRAFEPRPAPP